MSAESDAREIAQSHLEAEEVIRRRAHEIYRRRGAAPGSELDDWLQAEREILGGPASRTQDKMTVVGSAKRPHRAA